ncbi:ubiquitin carboxyl-terminal hydrolase 48-like [Chelonus insularis]|uniref:ubiquitin carboxyl-terminal hydrolase 48-like n=1 Tax=Chelonus insularis TaxID=460826 RepID=UPI00158B33B2|nr:ubiquitin carboxyl-terminal hydrolase 48-like [Chelonus insularis]XP_034947747.1 ubiquitin carboxyl-terminal hydrolase 48-like [Chelonus insularis]
MPNRPYPKRADVADKDAWSWVETVSPESIEREHLESSYRVNLNICKHCKRNCSYNPRCLVGLGEEKYLKSQPIEVASLESSLSELRDPTQYVGLKNLGATCYVNSLIQVWFHNEDMRRIIYKWKMMEDPEENESFHRFKDTNQPYQPVTVIGQLQYIFAMMQFGNRQLLDPTNLAIALSLDTGTQQDAQEFSKLLLAHIEGKLQQNLTLKLMLQQLTQGTYIYVNRCSTCSTEYKTSTTFYELDLQLASTLKNAIEKYLSEEELVGANRYHCQNCNEKRDAKRFIRLETLPDTLNFQLLRFVFHRESAQKKKLTSSIQFPEELDMSEYLKCPSQTHLYSLVAVLSHKGPSAHSGHYIVNICNSEGEWYQFSDDKVEKMQNKRIEDGTNDNGKPLKKGRVLKGCLSSSTAYMLVYKRLSAEAKVRKGNKSGKQKDDNHILSSNLNKNEIKDQVFETSIKESGSGSGENSKRKDSSDESPLIFSPIKKHKSEKDEEHHQHKTIDKEKNGKSDRNDIATVVKRLNFDSESMNKKVCKNIQDYENTNNNDKKHKTVPEELNLEKDLTCDELKRNNWEKTYQTLNGDAHRAMSCHDRDRYEELEFDKWELSEQLRELIRQENIKHELSLLAIQQENQKEIENQNLKRQEVIDFYTLLNSSDWTEYSWIPTSWLNKWLGDHSGLPDAVAPIDNSVLICTHYKLDPLKINRTKCIPATAAELLFTKYNGGPRLDNNSLCEICVKKRCKILKFKSELEKDRKEVTEIMKLVRDCTDNCYIVGAASMKYWRRLALENMELEDSHQDYNDFEIRGTGNSESKSENTKEDEEEESERILSFNEDLLCEHDSLRTPDAARKIVPAAAWSILKKYFPSAMEYPVGTPPCEICEEKVEENERLKKDDKIKAKHQKEELNELYFLRNRNEILRCPEKQYFILEKGFLETWRTFIRCGGRHPPPTDINNSHLLCEEHKGFLYLPTLTHELYGIITADEWTKLTELYKADYAIEIRNTGEDGKLVTVPGECHSCMRAREEKERIDSLTYDKATIYIQCVDGEENESAVKSSRPSRSRRKAKGSHQLKVSSQITLKELKVMTMNICGAPPIDQHLMLGDNELKDSNQNIGSLGVYPGALLKLKIDTPADADTNPESDSVGPEAASPEKGFKGTELVSS